MYRLCGELSNNDEVQDGIAISHDELACNGLRIRSAFEEVSVKKALEKEQKAFGEFLATLKE